MLRKTRRRRCGQTLIEYALIAALIALATISITGMVGTKIRNIFIRINTAIVTSGEGGGGASSSGGTSSGGTSSGGTSSGGTSSGAAPPPAPPPPGPPPGP